MTIGLRRTLAITTVAPLTIALALLASQPGLAACFQACGGDVEARRRWLFLAALIGLAVMASAYTVAKELMPQMRWTPLCIGLFAISCVLAFPALPTATPGLEGDDAVSAPAKASGAFQGTMLAGGLVLLGIAGMADVAAGRHRPPSRAAPEISAAAARALR